MHAQSIAMFCYKMAYTNEIQECLDNMEDIEVDKASNIKPLHANWLINVILKTCHSKHD